MAVRSVPARETPSHDYMYVNTIRLSNVDSYNHFKVKHVRIVRIPLLTHHLFQKGAACREENTSSYKLHVHERYELTAMYPCAYDYRGCSKNWFKTEVYNW